MITVNQRLYSFTHTLKKNFLPIIKILECYVRFFEPFRVLFETFMSILPGASHQHCDVHDPLSQMVGKMRLEIPDGHHHQKVA